MGGLRERWFWPGCVQEGGRRGANPPSARGHPSPAAAQPPSWLPELSSQSVPIPRGRVIQHGPALLFLPLGPVSLSFTNFLPLDAKKGQSLKKN